LTKKPRDLGERIEDLAQLGAEDVVVVAPAHRSAF
jgi:hypothetical protein